MNEESKIKCLFRAFFFYFFIFKGLFKKIADFKIIKIIKNLILNKNLLINSYELLGVGK